MDNTCLEKQNMALQTQPQKSFGNEQNDVPALPPYSAAGYSSPPLLATAPTQQAPTIQQPSYAGPNNQQYSNVQGAPPVVVVQQPPVIASNTVFQTVTNVPLGRSSTTVTCPACHCNVNSKASKKLKSNAWICCILLCLCGCELCFWIPFVMDSNYTTEHRCGNCNKYIGRSN